MCKAFDWKCSRIPVLEIICFCTDSLLYTISDVVIPTNSPDRASIVLKAGQRVMVLKSPKGIYMQLENGKIIAIRTAFKVGGAGKGSAAQHQECKPPLEKAEVNAPEYKKGVLPAIVVIVYESGISTML
jgi:hypothetical protein